MILIDGTFHSQAEIDAKGEAFLAATGIADPRLSVAVCLPETIDWLSAFFAIKRLGASILPLLPGTPLATARKLAKENPLAMASVTTLPKVSVRLAYRKRSPEA